jgi:hypothetical protein
MMTFRIQFSTASQEALDRLYKAAWSANLKAVLVSMLPTFLGLDVDETKPRDQFFVVLFVGVFTV